MPLRAGQSAKEISNLLDETLGAMEAAYAIADVICYTISHHIECPEGLESNLRVFAKKTVKMTHSTSQVMLTALTYTDRYFSLPVEQRFNESERNIHYKVFISVILSGHKYNSDISVVANVAWTSVCGDMFSVADINRMEWEFLTKIKFEIVVEDAETQKRWIDTIQDITEQADAYMMVKISSRDAIASILSSTNAMSSSMSIDAGQPRSRTGSVSSNCSTSSARSTRSYVSMDERRSRYKSGSQTPSSLRSAGSANGSRFEIAPKSLHLKRFPKKEAVSKGSSVSEIPPSKAKNWKGWKQFWKSLNINKVEECATKSNIQDTEAVKTKEVENKLAAMTL